MDSAGIVCPFCGKAAPIPANALQGAGGDPELLVVVIPPPGWMPHPLDPDRICHIDCAPRVDDDPEGLMDEEAVIQAFWWSL